MYNNQKQIGEAIKEKIEDRTIKRENLFIVDKLWNTQHQPDKVQPCLKKCLADLQLDYVDAFLMHTPMAYQSENEYADTGIEETVPIEDTWRAMENCVRQGYARSIGVSNFNKIQLERILKIAKFKPVINQIECHPYLVQKDLIEFCKKRKIIVMAYSPLYAPHRNHFDVSIFQDPVILEIAKKYGKSCGQIVLRYLTQLGVVPIPKSEKPIRLKQNINIFDFSLSVVDIRTIEKLNRNKRTVTFRQCIGFGEYPF